MHHTEENLSLQLRGLSKIEHRRRRIRRSSCIMSRLVGFFTALLGFSLLLIALLRNPVCLNCARERGGASAPWWRSSGESALGPWPAANWATSACGTAGSSAANPRSKRGGIIEGPPTVQRSMSHVREKEFLIALPQDYPVRLNLVEIFYPATMFLLEYLPSLHKRNIPHKSAPL